MKFHLHHNQNYNHPQTFVHDVIWQVYTQKLFYHVFIISLSYFAIYVLFEFGWIIFEWVNPIWLFTSPSIRNNRNLLHPVCHFRMCIKRVFFLSWKDRASRFIFFKIKIKSINKFTMIIEEFQIWKISNKRY